jgi:hypothetical protein
MVELDGLRGGFFVLSRRPPTGMSLVIGAKSRQEGEERGEGMRVGGGEGRGAKWGFPWRVIPRFCCPCTSLWSGLPVTSE